MKKSTKIIFLILAILLIYFGQKFFMWSGDYSTSMIVNPYNNGVYYVLQVHGWYENYDIIVSERPIWSSFFINIDSSNSVALTGSSFFHYMFDSSSHKLVIFEDINFKKYFGKNVDNIIVKRYKESDGDLDTLKIIK